VLGDPDEAIGARCGHLGGPLPEGSIVRHGASRCVECPWHGSVFRTDDGTVVHGPATAPQPAYEVDPSDAAPRRLRARRGRGSARTLG
jgi:nitrite reductase/ring-hydroxylating ferredoxin subunit